MSVQAGARQFHFLNIKEMHLNQHMSACEILSGLVNSIRFLKL